MARDSNGLPLIKNNISGEEFFYLECRQPDIHRLFVRYYKIKYPIAAPPFSLSKEEELSFQADSVFMIDLHEMQTKPLSLSRQGIYHFQTDTAKREGFTLICFYNGFPNIYSAEQMLPPLRYITTKNEFNDMMMVKNTKLAIDQFWLDKAGDPERAKELIRIYYNRVQDANLFFSSYMEGWKTDRGMSYIVFGVPYAVYRSPQNETWVYGEDRNILSMTLVFSKVNNPFSDNDYTLERSGDYKDIWYSAVDAWRK
jgi:GWxTD domain-containing protein